MKSKSGFGLMVLTLVATLMFYSTGVYAADVVKIGASHPLSGGVAENASWAVEGIKMVVEETNAKGGISIQGKNLKVELILYDSKCDPTTGVANVEKMINRDKVVAINGDTCSTCCLAQGVYWPNTSHVCQQGTILVQISMRRRANTESRTSLYMADVLCIGVRTIRKHPHNQFPENTKMATSAIGPGQTKHGPVLTNWIFK